MLQWFKNLSQQLNPQKNINPDAADVVGEQTIEESEGDQPLADRDYEFLFNQLLEGVTHGWQPIRVERFFEALEHRGTKEKWVEWLQRYGAKLLAAPTPNVELGQQMVGLGEVTRSLPDLQKIGDTASGIGRLLLTKAKKNDDSDTWQYDTSFTPQEPPETQETFAPLPPPPPFATSPDPEPSPPPTANLFGQTGDGSTTITLDELLLRLQQDENLVKQVSQRLGLDTTDPQEIIQELVRQINQRESGSPPSEAVSETVREQEPPTEAAPTPTANTGNEAAETAFNRGVQAYETQDFETAIAAWTQATQLKADYYQAWGNLGLGLKNLGRYEDSLNAYNRAIEIKPDFHKAWYNKGLALDELGQYEEAIAAYTKVLEIKPDFYKAWYSKGHSLENLGRSAEAVEAYNQAIELRADFYKTWSSRALSLKNLGRYDEALNSYDGALRLKNDDSDLWYNRGIVLAALGRYHEAIASYNKALELNKSDYHLFWYRGNALAQVGDNAQALANYDRTVDLKSDFIPAWCSRGQILGQLGQVTQAIASFDRALALKPTQPETWQQRGDLLLQTQSYQEALECYDRALTLQSDRSDYWNKRGQALLALGRVEEAIGCYDRSLQLQTTLEETWIARAEAVTQSPEADLLLASLSPIAQNYPNLNQRGYRGKIATLQQGLEVIPPDQYPDCWGNLQHQLGLSQFQEGATQEDPKPFWEDAIKAYQSAVNALSPDRFTLDHLRVLQDQLHAHLALEETQKAATLQENAIALLTQWASQTSSKTQQQQALLALSHLYHLGVDLAIQQGQRVKAWEKAEESKNLMLSWLLNLPHLRENALSWETVQQWLNPQAAIVYWHLSPSTLTTFLIKPDSPEPLIIGYTPNVVLNVVLSPSLRSRVKQAQQNSEASLEILLELLGMSGEEGEQFDEPTSNQPADSLSETSGNEYSDARQRRQQLTTWWDNWHNTANFPEQLIPHLQQLREILQIEPLLKEINSETTEHLILIPHQGLHSLPVAALFPESFTVTGLPSVKLGLMSPPPVTAAESPTAPTVDEEIPDPWVRSDWDSANLGENEQPPATKPTAAMGASSLLIIENPDSQDGMGQPLPQRTQGELEAAAIAHYFSPAPRLPSDRATVSQVISAFQQQPRYCHVLAQMTNNRKFPTQSAISLSQSDRLTGTNFLQLPCQSLELVSFAGAETLIGTNTLTTEEAGLTIGLLTQGVSYILKALWNVESGARPLLMIEFYRQLAQGKTPPLAFKSAQFWLRTVTYPELVQWYFDRGQDLSSDPTSVAAELEAFGRRLQEEPQKLGSSHPPYSHPYHWAAYVLLGV